MEKNVEKKTAVIFGASGVIGRNLAERLVAVGSWDVVCVSRHVHHDLPASKAIACDLTDSSAVRPALEAAKGATHVFLCNWSPQANEAENCRVNGLMVRNALESLAAAGKLRHAALVTGLKHYLGP